MTVLHTGSTKKFSSNWETIFGKGSKQSAAKGAPKTSTSARPAAKAKSAEKKAKSRK